MIWHWLTGAVIVAHYAFLAYVLVGGFLAWRRPRTVLAHVAAVAWGIAIVTTDVQCPLTWAQDRLRQQVGSPPLRDGFLETYVEGRLVPAGHEQLLQVLAAAVVVVSWIGLARRFAETRRPPSRRHSTPAQ